MAMEESIKLSREVELKTAEALAEATARAKAEEQLTLKLALEQELRQQLDESADEKQSLLQQIDEFKALHEQEAAQRAAVSVFS